MLTRRSQRRNRQHRRTVPVKVEHGRRLIDDRTGHPDIEVSEVRQFGRVEIGVADIASPGNRQPAVGNPQLVVHPACRTEGTYRQFEPATEAIRSGPTRIKQAHVDIGMGIERNAETVVDACIDVVEQQADADTAIGRPDDLARQKKSCQVVLPVIILQIEAAPCPARRKRPRHESFDVVGNERDRVLAGSGGLQ